MAADHEIGIIKPEPVAVVDSGIHLGGFTGGPVVIRVRRRWGRSVWKAVECQYLQDRL